jgi:hypothetical protein
MREVQAKDVYARTVGAKPAGRARRVWLILIAPVAEVLTSPLVFGLLRRALWRAGGLPARLREVLAGLGLPFPLRLSGHVLWPRR